MFGSDIRKGSKPRPLTPIEAQFVGCVKELSGELHAMLIGMGKSIEQEQALLRLEEAVMWATKHVATHGHANEMNRS